MDMCSSHFYSYEELAETDINLVGDDCICWLKYQFNMMLLGVCTVNAVNSVLFSQS